MQNLALGMVSHGGNAKCLGIVRIGKDLRQNSPGLRTLGAAANIHGTGLPVSDNA